MFTTKGKLVAKSLYRSGLTPNGAWKAVEFLIEKTRKGEKYKTPFIAKGRLAERVMNMNINDRIEIEFWISGWHSDKSNRWFPNLNVIDVRKWVKKPKYEFPPQQEVAQVEYDKNQTELFDK